jgi:hypothetical protein
VEWPGEDRWLCRGAHRSQLGDQTNRDQNKSREGVSGAEAKLQDSSRRRSSQRSSRLLMKELRGFPALPGPVFCLGAEPLRIVAK